MKIAVLAKFNQYESKRHFAKKMAEASRRTGVEVDFFDSDSGSYIDNWKELEKAGYGFACSFNRFNPLPDGQYLWEKLQIPFISFLIDPAVYNKEAFTTPKSFATCVDRDDFAFASAFGKGNVFFMPHAVEPELFSSKEEKIYPVVFIGSSYDPENLKTYWTKHLPRELCDVVEDAVQSSFEDIHKPFLQATVEALEKRKLKAADVPFDKLYYYVDYYMRGYDRVELIRSIKDVEVHVFGGTCWRREKPLVGWNRYLLAQSNVILHPAVTFEESLEILKKSKICLNSVPTLRNGSHERVFSSYACGALPISSDNLYWREVFGDDIVLYPYDNRQLVAEKVKELLADEPLRRSLLERGREKVLSYHTWDHRVQDLFTALPRILSSELS